jgi:hypothetical protein
METPGTLKNYDKFRLSKWRRLVLSIIPIIPRKTLQNKEENPNLTKCQKSSKNHKISPQNPTIFRKQCQRSHNPKNQ